jgi:hypothetical protein
VSEISGDGARFFLQTSEEGDFVVREDIRHRAPFTRAAAGIRPLPFDLISSWRSSRRHTPHIGTMKSAPQCGPGKSCSTTFRNYTLLCIHKSSKQTGNLPGGM